LVVEARRASRTALGSAYQRAAHLVHDPPPWILEDRLAGAIVGQRFYEASEAVTATWRSDLFAAFRAHFTVRARLAEDVVVDGLGDGRVDYVLLGAGADTFAWRHPDASALTIWELDHPASQAWKREALGRMGLLEPVNVRWIAADLTSVSLGELELPARATWNWLGVTQYLSKQASESVLCAIAGQGAGTAAVVEFLLDEAECDELGALFRSQARTVAEQAGEPMISFYRRAEVEDLLAKCGFRSIELLDAKTLGDRYLRRSVSLHLPGAAIFALART
jgi:methyltransferase (TIGR00027 family)